MISMFVHACVKVVVQLWGGGVLSTETSVNNYIHHKNVRSKVGQNKTSVRLRKMPPRSHE